MSNTVSDVIYDIEVRNRLELGMGRVKERREHVITSLEAVKAGINPSVLGNPMLLDSVEKTIKGTITEATELIVEGEGELGINVPVVKFDLRAKVGYEKDQSQGVQVTISTKCSSSGAPDVSATDSMTKEELESLKTVLDSSITRYETELGINDEKKEVIKS